MTERERFVPHPVGDLTAALAALPWTPSGEARLFIAFSRITSALFHHEFLEREQLVTHAWDRIGEDPGAPATVTAELSGLLDAANYTPLSMAELDDALATESLIPLRLDVHLEEYDELLIYRRGSRQDTVTVPKWRGFRSEDKAITIDERVVVHSRVRPQRWFDDNGIDPADHDLVPGHVSLRLFQNVPRADVEMLLPSTRVRFRPLDGLLIGVPALASGIAVIATKLLPTLGLVFLLVAAWLGLRDDQPELDQAALVILLGGAVTLGGFVFTQLTKLKNRRLQYQKTLSENLYFRMLATGPGVFHILLSAAQEQEVAEVLLAYRFLLDAPDGATAAELDEAIEAWLLATGQHDIDFEVPDAVAKLRRLEVVEGRRRLRAVPLREALAQLDRRWDDVFQFQSDDLQGASAPPLPGAGRIVRLRTVVDRFRGRAGDRKVRRDGG